jgi:hypothetical protein
LEEADDRARLAVRLRNDTVSEMKNILQKDVSGLREEYEEKLDDISGVCFFYILFVFCHFLCILFQRFEKNLKKGEMELKTLKEELEEKKKEIKALKEIV